jgi:DNA-binding transcriptional ArsR family regulator
VADVFRALADEGRRALLDALFERDGQSLAELGAVLPAMTRFGVAKHLRVLEDAGLVTTMRSGRSKLHYLNPVPIRLIHDRWISKYAEPWVASMSRLKSDLEHADEGASVDASDARGPRAAQHHSHDQGYEPSPRSA